LTIFKCRTKVRNAAAKGSQGEKGKGEMGKGGRENYVNARHTN